MCACAHALARTHSRPDRIPDAAGRNDTARPCARKTRTTHANTHTTHACGPPIFASASGSVGNFSRCLAHQSSLVFRVSVLSPHIIASASGCLGHCSRCFAHPPLGSCVGPGKGPQESSRQLLQMCLEYWNQIQRTPA
jgi:hypothetical protein